MENGGIDLECKKKLALNILFILIILLQEYFVIRVICHACILSLDNQYAACNVEHWLLWMLGENSFFTTNIFFPLTNNIGLVDMMFIFAPIYSISRMVMPHSAAFIASAIFVHVLGLSGMYILCRKSLKLSSIATYSAICFFAYSTNFQVQMGHIYLLAISLLPWISYFLLEVKRAKDKKRKLFHLICFGSSFILLCYSAVYIAQYVVLMILVSTFIMIFIDLSHAKYLICSFIGELKEYINVYICALLYSIVSFIPFFYAYWPRLRESGGYSVLEELTYSPDLMDLINVGTGNYVYGDIISSLGMHQGEWTIGYPVFTGLLLYVLFKYYFKNAINKDEKRILKVLLLSLICSVFLIIKINGQFNLWSIVRDLIPGGTSMRAMSRFVLFSNFYLALILAYSVNCWGDKIINSYKYTFLAVVCLLIFTIENTTTLGLTPVDYKLLMQEEKVSKIPSACEVFFVYDSKITEEKIKDANTYNYRANNMAFRIANENNIRTTNGIASIFPAGTYELFDVYNKRYISCVKEWISVNRAQNVYGYDLATDTWSNAVDIMK